MTYQIDYIVYSREMSINVLVRLFNELEDLEDDYSLYAELNW